MNQRLLTKTQAAEYCGYSVNRFADLVREGVFPQQLTGLRRWDIKKLDITLDQLSGIDTNENLSALEQWKAKRHEDVN